MICNKVTSQHFIFKPKSKARVQCSLHMHAKEAFRQPSESKDCEMKLEMTILNTSQSPMFKVNSK